MLLAPLDHLGGQLGKVGEGAVDDHARYGGIARGVHQARRCSHAPSPKGNGRRFSSTGGILTAQVGNDGGQIIALVVTEADVLSVGFAAAGKVERQDRHSEAEQVRQLGQYLEAGAAVAVQVDDARDAGGRVGFGVRVRRTSVGPVAAFENHAPVVDEVEIAPLEGLASEAEVRRAQRLVLVGCRAGRADDGVDAFLVAHLGHGDDAGPLPTLLSLGRGGRVRNGPAQSDGPPIGRVSVAVGECRRGRARSPTAKRRYLARRMAPPRRPAGGHRRLATAPATNTATNATARTGTGPAQAAAPARGRQRVHGMGAGGPGHAGVQRGRAAVVGQFELDGVDVVGVARHYHLQPLALVLVMLVFVLIY
mmetsp:Transcript_13964/g.33351  ORF Transcript_13964/g.33351 Transcript_13964/m.33351 type:complete len:365 (+) Transcript_13964:1055-2149(+)